MEAKVYITGPIGSGYDDEGTFQRGVELIDVIAQVQNYGDSTKDLLVEINSPGGYVDVGNSIYDYLDNLKSKGYKIKTYGKQLVGSIATKIFLVGEERELEEGTEFFIHNPMTNPGYADSNKLQKHAEKISQVEAELRKFYVEKTGTDEDVLKPLMDVETSMNPDQAMSLGFATIISESFPLIAQVKMNLIDKVLKSAKAMAGIKAMQEVKLADGKVVKIEVEEGGSLEGAPATLDGQPVPVGEHALEGGKILVVTEAGKVGAIKEVEVEEEETIDSKVEKLAQSVQMIMDALNGYDKKQEEKMTAAITALKSEIKTGHRPEKKADKNFVANKEITVQQITEAKASGNVELYKELYFKKYGKEPNV